MEENVFIINNRFRVDELRNEIIDRNNGQKHRLETRFMKLLCLLATQPATVVKRDFIIEQIWNNYPGANEGLNQAISFLRKFLDDGDKQIIETKPKIGYIFNVTISFESEETVVKARNYTPLIIAASLILLLMFFMAGKYYGKKDTVIDNKQQLFERDAAVPKNDSAHQAEELKRWKDTTGNAEMKRQAKIDARISRTDSMQQTERLKKHRIN